MPCRDSERVKKKRSQRHISDLRRSAAEGERDPAGGTAVTHTGLSIQTTQENVTDKRLSPPT